MAEAAPTGVTSWKAADGSGPTAASSAARVKGTPSRNGGLAWLRRAVPTIDPLRLFGLILFVLAWHVLSLFFQPIILPPPLAVLVRLLADFWDAPALSYYGVAEPNLYANLIYTAENVAIAVACGAVLGIVAGLVSARVSLFRAIVDPIMTTAGTVPILVAAPFLLIWFGVGRASAVGLVTFYVTVILYLFAQKAASNLNPIYEEFARTLGAGPRQVIVDLLLPATVPEILGGLRIALAGAWGLEAVSELLGSQEGMGKVLEVLAGATDPEGIMATLLLLGFVAICVDGLVALMVTRLAGWHAGLQAGASRT